MKTGICGRCGVFLLLLLLPLFALADDGGYYIEGTQLTVTNDAGMARLSDGENALFQKTVTEIVIAEGVMAIPDRVFAGYDALIRVALPSTLLHIGEDAFSGADHLESVRVPSNDVWFSHDDGYYLDGTHLVVTSDAGMEAWAAMGTDKPLFAAFVTAVTVEEGVTKIADAAFSDFQKLVDVSLPPSVKEIGTYAFCACESITAFEIPAACGNLDVGVLSGTNIAELVIPETVQWVDTYSISTDCLKRLIVAGDLRFYENRLLQECPTLEQLVFLQGPPTIDIEFMIGARATPTVYYLNENEALWRPNGEMTWHGCPLVGIDTLADLPDSEPPCEHAERYGYLEEQDSSRGKGYYRAEVYSDAGWQNLCEQKYMLTRCSVELFEGVTTVDVNKMHVYALERLHLPASLTSLTVDPSVWIGEITVDAGNPYYRSQNGRLHDLRNGSTVYDFTSAAPTPNIFSQMTPTPTVTPVPTPTATPMPTPSPTAEPVVAEETTDLRIPLLLGAIAIVAAAAVIVKRHP